MSPTNSNDRSDRHQCYQEGYEAASHRKSFKDYCPYSFDKTNLSHTHEGHYRYDVEWRLKMDAWFNGWKAWLDEHGLGNDFEQTRSKKVCK